MTQISCASCGEPLPEGAVGQAMRGSCPRCLARLALRGEKTVIVTEPEATSEIPAELGPYQILGLLGRGGMGSVYRARQQALDREVAIKFLPEAFAAEPELAERFRREARTLARLSHPNIVAVHDSGEIDGRCYLVMELVDGVSLRSLIEGGELSAPQALRVVSQVCDALEYAHSEGVVHRDIKPENVLLDGRGQVKVADFGLAKLTGDDQTGPALTRTRAVMGTPHYMAPEQVESSGAVDHRADIYALGVMFYELLTGELPLGRFDPPSHKVQIDVRLDEVVLRALAKEPERRYQRASEVREQIERCSEAPAAEAGGPTLERLLLDQAAVAPGWALTARYRSLELPHVAGESTTDRAHLLGSYGKPAGVEPEQLAAGYIAGLSRGRPERSPKMYFILFQFSDAAAQQRMSRYLKGANRPSFCLEHVVVAGGPFLGVGHLYCRSQSARRAFERVVGHWTAAGLEEGYRSPMAARRRRWPWVALVVGLAYVAGMAIWVRSKAYQAGQEIGGKAAGGLVQVLKGGQKKRTRSGAAPTEARLEAVWITVGPVSTPAAVGGGIYHVDGTGRLWHDGVRLDLWSDLASTPPASDGERLWFAGDKGWGVLQWPGGGNVTQGGQPTLVEFAVDRSGRIWGLSAKGQQLTLVDGRKPSAVGPAMGTPIHHISVHPESGSPLIWRDEGAGTLAAYGPTSGKLIWKHEGLALPPALFPEVIAVARRDRSGTRVAGLDPETGELLWQADPDLERVSLLVGERGHLYVGGWRGGRVALRRMDVATGKRTASWTYDGGLPEEAAVTDGVIYARGSDQKGLTAFDTHQGKVAWRWKAPTTISGPIVSSGRVVVSGGNGALYVLAAVKPSHTGWHCVGGDVARTRVRR